MKKDDTTKARPLNSIFKELRKRPGYEAAYEKLAPEYALYEAMIKALKDSELTQKEVARRMKTSEAAVSRLFDIGKRHAPSWKTIMKFAHAVGKRPVLKFVDC